MNGQSQDEKALTKAIRNLNNIKNSLEIKGLSKLSDLKTLSSADWDTLDIRIETFIDQANDALDSINIDNTPLHNPLFI
jgi:hypothetical protein